ncbi:MAG: glycoside hydrolase family 13 protein [Bacteroidales bacterium]|nr:glycoside hydrolase family 13 protein [Bacteroidales bacterium]
MKKIITALVLATSLSAGAVTVERIDPPNWWTGMTNDTLQLLVYGQGIADADVTVSHPGVKLLESIAPGSPNYKIVYLSVGDDAKPGEAILSFSVGKDKTSVKYPLSARDGILPHTFDAGDVLYLVMPDRFADGDTTNNSGRGMRYPVTVDRSRKGGRHGGDLQGLRDRLDYIDSLGVTAIWVNPVLENDVRGGSYHGYATTDYYRIDPRFGSNDEWRTLIDEAHARGLKVVMDMIFNHSGISHPWIADRPSPDWYNGDGGDDYLQTNYRLSTIHDPYASQYDRKATTDGWFVRGMPDLNQRNPHLMHYLIQNSIWWIEASKIDGIRMDTHPYADVEGMARWIADVDREYPGYNIVGECWYPGEAGAAAWQRDSRVNPGVETNLPSVMDFSMMTIGPEAFLKPGEGARGLDKLYEHLALDYLFADPQHILTFFDNHDTDRFLAGQPDNLDGWKQAMTWLLTTRGIPQLYYGTEILMSGTRRDGGDGNVRRDMPGAFPGDSVTVFTREGRTPMQNEARDFLASLLDWRKGEANDIIARGSLKHYIPRQGVYIYERRLGDRLVVVMLNGNETEATVPVADIAETIQPGTVMHDVITGRDITVEPGLTLPPRGILLLQ